MMIENRFSLTFSPFGSSTGFFLILGGIAATWFSVYGLIIVFAGLFALFTDTSTRIDTKGRKIRHSDNLFGLIPIGKWIAISPGMKLGIKKSHRGFVGYTRATQSMSIHEHDIRIILYSSDNKPIMPLKSFSSIESAREDIKYFSQQLGIPVLES
jgi:hypothetical protein